MENDMNILRGRGLAVLATSVGIAHTGNACVGPDERLERNHRDVARKRDESFQSVPITVDVFTAQKIQVGGNRISSRLHRDGA